MNSPQIKLFVLLLAAVSYSSPVLAQKVLDFKGELKRTAKDKKAGTEATTSVKLEEGKEYLINLTAKDFDPFLKLRDTEGKDLDANDDGAGYGLNARLGLAPMKTGEYQLVAGSFQQNGAGQFTLTVQAIKKVGSAKEKKDEELKSDDPASKTEKPTSYRLFKESFEKGKIYKIDVESKDFDPFLTVYKEKGNLVAADGDSSGNKNARLFFIPQQSGVFEVRVAAQAKGDKGNKAKEGRPATSKFSFVIQEYEWVEK